MRRALLVGVGVAIGALLCVGESPCFADGSSIAGSLNATTSSPTELELAVARERFLEGIKLYSKRKYEQARLAFLQAYVLTKRINVLLNLAQATLRANRPVEALHYFQQVAQSPEATPEQKARAESFAEEARSQTGQIKIVAPDGATIELDGQDAGRAPLSAPLDVAPGAHRVRIVSSAEIKNAVVTIAPGTREEVMLTPKPKLQDEPRPEPKTEPKDQAPGFFSPPSTMAPVYAGGAVGIVGFSIAAIFGGLAANDSSSAATATKAITQAGGNVSVCNSLATNAQYTGACQIINSANASSAPREQLFEVSLGVGIAGAVTALGWYFLAPKEGAEHSADHSTDSRIKLPKLAPFIADRTAGALLEGSF